MARVCRWKNVGILCVIASLFLTTSTNYALNMMRLILPLPFLQYVLMDRIDLGLFLLHPSRIVFVGLARNLAIKGVTVHKIKDYEPDRPCGELPALVPILLTALIVREKDTGGNPWKEEKEKEKGKVATKFAEKENPEDDRHNVSPFLYQVPFYSTLPLCS